MGVAVGKGVGVCVGVAVAVGKGVAVTVNVRVTVEVGVRVGVEVEVGVRVTAGVKVLVGVAVAVDVRVDVRVGVGVGVGARTDSDAVAATCCLIAEIVTLDDGAVPGVVTVNVADVEPAGMVTVAGTAATAVFELVRYTSSPPAGAAVLRVTVPTEEIPATTVVGLRLNPVGRGEVAVSTPVAFALVEAETTVSTSFGTAAVVAVNVAVLAPAATVTEAGTDTTGADAVNVTTVPPEGAGPLRVTVPVAEAPPATEAGENVTLRGTGAVVSDRATLFVAPP